VAALVGGSLEVPQLILLRLWHASREVLRIQVVSHSQREQTRLVLVGRLLMRLTQQLQQPPM